MLYLFGFDEIGVVVGDLFFVDANPGPGQEGAEKGVRVELAVPRATAASRLGLLRHPDRGRDAALAGRSPSSPSLTASASSIACTTTPSFPAGIRATASSTRS